MAATMDGSRSERPKRGCGDGEQHSYVGLGLSQLDAIRACPFPRDIHLNLFLPAKGNLMD